MRLRVALTLSLVVSTSLAAQSVTEPVPAPPSAASSEPATPPEASRPQKLRVISQATTENFIAKFNSTGGVTDSGVFESATGFLGIGTTAPSNALHIRIPDGAANVPLKLETSGADSITGLSLKNDVRNWHLRVDGTDADKFKIYDANAGVYRLAIDDWGRVGINTSDPKSALAIYGTNDTFIGMGPDPMGVTGSAMNVGYGGNSFGAGSGFINVRPHASAIAPNPSFRIMTGNVPRMMITNTGAVGIGTLAPAERLHVHSDDPGAVFVQMQSTSTALNSYAGARYASSLAATSYAAHGTRDITRYGIPLSGWSEIVNYAGNGQIIGTSNPTPIVFGTHNVERVRILGDGNVGIGTPTPAAKLHVIGDIVATGSITGARVIGAKYQDLAEWVPAAADLAPGTVVVLNLEKPNEVLASSREYDVAVAGVVSEQPGIILGVEGAEKEQIATTGRVKVRVDARNRPIRIGDLLVTSGTPGMAMRSDAVDIGGHRFHKPGTIIGKALEPLADGTGEVLVLLSMQ
ncbi:MAG TPA: hypothetical protein VF432_31280 [Thermoanaerobaculia bacterium]